MPRLVAFIQVTLEGYFSGAGGGMLLFGNLRVLLCHAPMA
jgi:hypothetical protein